nr:repeat element protein 6 [Hyposoter didymator ichnovirus]ABC24710.1 repeat element protein 6 [Hyposoter didymator ichnovirus]
MPFNEDHDRTHTYPVDTFTFRGPAMPNGAPFSFIEFIRFNVAYQQFLTSIRNLDLTFLNGKACPVRYSFDATRPEEDRLLINWDWLMPLFWERPPGERDFVRLPVILQFVKNIRFQKCKAVASDTCSCEKKPNKVVSPGRECKNELHWHHFCTAHVSAWLTKYMIPAILLKESKEMFTEIIANVHQNNPDVLEYYSMAERTDTQVLLDSARNSSGHGAA